MGFSKTDLQSIFLLVSLLGFGFTSAVPVKDDVTWAPEPTPSPDFDCPDMEDGFYPSPTSCSVYYHCTNGLAWREECPAGLHFNPRTNECDYPENVGCNIGGSTTSPTTTTIRTTPTPTTTTTEHWWTTEEQETPAPETTTAAPTTTTPPGGFVCPQPNGNFRDPEDCAAFFACENSVVVGHQVCPDGLLFNPAIGNCDYAWNVDCD